MKTTALIVAALLTAAGWPHAATAQEQVERERRVVVKIEDGGEPEVVLLGKDGSLHFKAPFARRGFLGVSLLDLTPELRRHFGSDPEAGVLVSRVLPDSPAARAGLEVGDLLIALDGRPASSAHRAAREIARRDEGDSLTLGVLRDGSNLELVAELTEADRPRVDLGDFLWRCREGEECDELSLTDGTAVRRIPIDPQRLDEAMRQLDQELASGEWRDKVMRFRGDYEGLEERIRELEKNLLELQKQLGDLPD